MRLLSPIITWFTKKRIHQINRFIEHPHDVQNEVFHGLVKKARNTSWGKEYGYRDIKHISEFQERVPISTYEELFPHIEKIMKGEQNVLWPSKIKWFAKSSGTTNARSKFIPVSPEALKDCHFKGGKDMISIYVNNFPSIDVFRGKSLSVGGSHQINELNAKSYYGDVSAVITQNLPFWVQLIRTPKLKTALMDKWEDKLQAMIRECSEQNVTCLAGVPTWTVVLLQEVVKHKGANSILDVWPNLEVFVHGAVAFGPYESVFKELIPSDKMNYLEVYNASEGFFGIQDQPGEKDMLLMLDYGIFYEFVPIENIDEDHPKTLTIEEVEIGKSYSMLITTNAGLWRYAIGDTVRFVSKDPYKIRISGRTKHFINAFGEEVVVENADAAVTAACEKTGAIIENYTAAPIYLEADGKKGGHEWLIEFEKEPNDLGLFTHTLDAKLREINSDYDAKRQHDIALLAPKIHSMPSGAFKKWLESKGKMGGQNKVPRLSNDRETLEEILKLNS